MLKAICVFCGSRPGNRPDYTEAAEHLGRELGRRNITTVYGGASVGLMATVTNAALAAGGKVIGVIPRSLVDRELAHEGLTELVVVDDLFERKRIMMDRSDAFVALPGGVGTLDELFEVLTWRVLSEHSKPIGVLDAQGFYGPLRGLMDHLVQQGFYDRASLDLLEYRDTAAGLIDALAIKTPAGPRQ